MTTTSAPIVFRMGCSAGTGLSSSVEGGYFAYGDKHCFGSTGGVTDSSLLVLNTECEQGQPLLPLWRPDSLCLIFRRDDRGQRPHLSRLHLPAPAAD